jgi:hypothetical protein
LEKLEKLEELEIVGEVERVGGCWSYSFFVLPKGIYREHEPFVGRVTNWWQ